MSEYSDMNTYLAENTLPFRESNAAIRGEGIKFWDKDGNEYIDFASQTLNLLLGQCHPNITKALIEQVQTLTYVSSRFGTEVYLNAAKLLHSISPNKLSKVNIKMCDGSDANETAVKTARKYTGKTGIISFKNMHTGQTTQTIQLRGYDRNKKTLIGNWDDVHFVSPPECKKENDYTNSLNEIKKLLEENNNIAGLLIDPLMVNGGLLVNDSTGIYLREVEKLCREYNIIFIVDENQTFGWFEGIFASRYYEINPDIITLGKGLSGGHPLAGVIIKDYLNGVLAYNEADFTHGGHPLCCSALIATIETLLNTNFNIKEKENLFKYRFKELSEKVKNKFEYRGTGIIWCFDLSSLDEDSKLTSTIYNLLLNKGVFLRQYRNRLIFKPPVIVSEEDINKVMDIFSDIVEEVLCN